MKLVLLESPYAGDVEANVAYARAAMRDCLLRGEAPFASHLLYTQPQVLRDEMPSERALGIEAGLTWGALAALTVVYGDLGVSAGMRLGIDRAIAEGRQVEHRSLSGWPERVLTLAQLSETDKEILLDHTKVLLQSENGFWRANCRGYTDRDNAAIYTGREAYQASNHCGPEKQVRYFLLPGGGPAVGNAA